MARRKDSTPHVGTSQVQQSQRWHARMFVVALAAIALLATGVAGGLLLARGAAYLYAASPENPASIRGCVVRFDTLSSSGKSVVPRIHANSTHICVGVTSVAVDWQTGDLLVRNDGGPGKIVSLSVSTDETLTTRGITCGGSGGGISTRIRCYGRDGKRVPVYSLKMHSSRSNLWLSWFMWQD